MNPYCLLTPALLEAMLRQPMYFVRQYYHRGEWAAKKEGRIPLLISHYTHHEIDRERALRHMRLLKTDAYRFHYNSNNADHVEKLRKAAQQPEGYKIFTNVMPQKWEPSRELRLKTFQYLQQRFPSFTADNQTKLNIRLQDLYGKLYLFIRWKTTTVEVLADEVEYLNTRELCPPDL